MFFGLIFTQPDFSFFFSYYCLFWPPEMIVNIIGDVYRSIFIFTVFGVDFHSVRLFFLYYSLFWPPEMIVNIIGDVYRSILFFTVFGIFHFWAFLAWVLTVLPNRQLFCQHEGAGRD